MGYKNKICIISSSRADYNHLYPLMLGIKKSKELDLQIIATGMHLIRKHGMTYKEIENDKFFIDRKVPSKQKTASANSLVEAMATELKGIAVAFSQLKPDLVIILGDRYDIFPAAIATHILQIPLAHIHGGEVTSGVIDDGIRHSISKLANLHFVATNEFKNRLISMGEENKSIVNIGSLAVQGNKKIKKYSKADILKRFSIINYNQYFVITVHPETINSNNKKLIKNILLALESFKDYYFIFTGTNSDTDSSIISKNINEFIKKNKKQAALIESSGRELYVNMMKHSALIIGNSSSGIIESPSLHTASINIGNRQAGRPLSKSIFSSSYELSDIITKINHGLKFDFIKNKFKPKYQGNGSIEKIINRLLKINKNKLLHKKFFDK
jgi:GDP/UDP-N,N'-diacetylbacillosamine 2-epimerase (hydrolysing)